MSIIQSYGHLYFTGSYFLDTMTWRDIDMQLCLIEGQDAKEVLGTISSSLIKKNGIKKFQFIDFLNYPRPP